MLMIMLMVIIMLMIILIVIIRLMLMLMVIIRLMIMLIVIIMLMIMLMVSAPICLSFVPVRWRGGKNTINEQESQQAENQATSQENTKIFFTKKTKNREDNV